MDLTNSASTIREYDNENYVHPWDSITSMGSADRTIAGRAEGIYVYDQDGRRLIDGPGGMWCVQIGYGRQEMADAISRQVMELAYHSPWHTASEPSALLAHKIAERAPGDLNKVFFTTGGSTAVDSALRFAQFYNNCLGRPEKKQFISRERAYHGSTYLAATVTGKERSKSLCDTERRLCTFLPDVDPKIRPDNMSPEDWCAAKVQDLEDAILEIGPDKVAAFIAEPILASGGVIIPPEGYHLGCLEVCRKYDVLYISDEVVTGFGRLGHWFASKEVFGIEPDMITCAKGLTSGYLPLGACVISERLIREIKDRGRDDLLFSNGYTYSGHPVSCAAGLASMEIMEREKILEHVRDISPYFQHKLQELESSPVVRHVRGIGLVGSIEGHLGGSDNQLASDKKFGELVDTRCEEKGLIVRPLLNMCVFSPPLIITRSQVDEMFGILEEAISQLAADQGLAPGQKPLHQHGFGV